MGIEQYASPVFAGHQTFHPRFGWLKKGVDACRQDPHVFNAPDAPLRLGVGKNMVEAIRFWCQAFHLTTKVKNQERKRSYLSVPTVLGEALLGEQGLDPYFEHTGSLWLLHWQAVSSGSFLPVWWCTFNDLHALEFEEAQLLSLCVDEIEASTWSAPLESSIKKDVDCLLRMYSRRGRVGRQTVDDLMDSPFRELGLIVPAASGSPFHRFARGAKATLPSAIVTYAALDFLARSNLGAGTISVSRLASDEGSPGRLFKLTDENILAALEQNLESGGYSIATPGGAPQIVVDGNIQEVATRVLLSYYGGYTSQCTVEVLLAGHEARYPVSDPHSQLDLELSPRPRRRKGSAA